MFTADRVGQHASKYYVVQDHTVCKHDTRTTDDIWAAWQHVPEGLLKTRSALQTLDILWPTMHITHSVWMANAKDAAPAGESFKGKY